MKLSNIFFSVLLALVFAFVAMGCNGNSDQKCECDVNAVVYIEDMPCACNGVNCTCADRAVAKCTHLPTAEVHVDDSICPDPHCNILPENIFYGVLETNPPEGEGSEIRIFKIEGVTDQQVFDAIPNIQAGYDGMDGTDRRNFEAKAPTRIVVIGGSTIYTWNIESGILGLNYIVPVNDIAGAFSMIANDTLPEV